MTRIVTSLESKPSFRTRAEQSTRLDAFVDSAFAFAVTLVIISVGSVPDSVPAVVQAMKGAPAFVLCFLVLVSMWLRHREWKHRYGIEDPVMVRLSVALVFFVLLFAYPLRLLFALFIAWATRGAGSRNAPSNCIVSAS